MSRPSSRPSTDHVHHQQLPPSPFPPPFPPANTQSAMHMPYSDPFHTKRDPFLHGGGARRDSNTNGASRTWASTTAAPPHPLPPPVAPAPSQHHPPLYPPNTANGLASMPLPFDPSRRSSLGGPGSPPHYARGPIDPSTTAPPSFQARAMPPPPSPPQMLPPSSSSSYAPAPRGPPTTSSFGGMRELPPFSSSHRPGTGMAISSILSGGGEERRVSSSPNSTSAGTSAAQSMQPPSPGRARSSSLREGLGRKDEGYAKMGGLEPRASTAFHERTVSEPRGDGAYGSPQFQRDSIHSFRNFQPNQQDQRPPSNGLAQLGRPSSQPIEAHGQRNVDDPYRRDAPNDSRYGAFRQFGDLRGPPPRNDAPTHHAPSPYQNSMSRERDGYGAPQHDREPRYEAPRYQPSAYGNSIREEQSGSFRPGYTGPQDGARESIESRVIHDSQREIPRSTPSHDQGPYDRYRNGYSDRPLTFEEHQRMEAAHREQHRKGSNDSAQNRAIYNISPELSRRGRNSPLPQAVQGAQPRHVGPGGDNPGIKMEFGRMFSGLGSGVGSTTPTPGQMNGSTTPSRMSPMRQADEGDLVRTAVSGIDDGRNSTKPRGKSGRKSGRRSREDTEKMEGDGRGTPDLQRGNKRPKTTHHHHHVHPHHHHHDPADAQAGPFNMLRFPSNPGVSQPAAQPAAHHHHRHHNQTAHHHHHHHHTARPLPPPRKPTLTIVSKRLLDDCANKPRKHLGSQLYSTEPFATEDLPCDARIKANCKSKTMPLFEGKENCTFTVRVPRWYITTSEDFKGKAPGQLEEICRRRQLWGVDVYTDDSDVVAAAVHSGWLQGDFGEWNDDLRAMDGIKDESNGETKPQLSFESIPSKAIRAPKNHDLHITVLILPPLEKYTGLNQNHILSRHWDKTHDGMSFMIHRLDFVDEGPDSRYAERGVAARKQRLAREEAERNEAAAGLLLFANGVNGVHGDGSVVKVGA